MYTFGHYKYSELLRSRFSYFNVKSLSKQGAESLDFKPGQHLRMHRRIGMSLKTSVPVPETDMFPLCYLPGDPERLSLHFKT